MIETFKRLTSQKKIIIDFLKSTKSHPTAEEVYLKAKRKLPRISLGTVYRILKDLKEKREIQEIPVMGISHFDGDVSSHAHFICQECERIFDVFEDACRDCEIVKRKKIKVGKIHNYQMIFYGFCKDCWGSK